ncbi:ATP-dependent proteinase. Serine peptidase. MEROPS family S16 [Ectothiorhodosinus mongolicus]|uniref:Lon protease n=1 Tax=Ectothiorhodosinus mongolicus TaxID=233100 RepID=A0A1R3VRU1_9GAMM|nr:endopeptidase La [Ectothiorhodosinus mongolicus]ULX56566.1 endopeptidase La [Ectothiorhodosinus mongolicus]SIT66342.1 ATP-dependent proteinase. Serine peptidase. MEROPS family S16 [Ectothiorhodosinus mongolicus]
MPDKPQLPASAAQEPMRHVPVLPLRDVVVYPHMVIPLFVGREKSIRALDAAMTGNKQILLVAQKSADEDEPSIDAIYRTGTLSTVLQLLKLPDGTIKVLVEGVERARVVELTDADVHFSAQVMVSPQPPAGDEREMEVLCRSVMSLFEQYVKLNKKIPPEILTSLAGIDDAARLADTIAAHMALKLEEKQKILEIDDVQARLEHIMSLIEGEIDLLQIEKRIRGRVKQQMEKSQREYYLNEQMKAIQKELGDMDDVPNEIEELQRRIDTAGMPKEALQKAQNELNKLKMMSPMSAEATVVRNYVEWLANVPWKKRSKVRIDIAEAQDVLDQDHYGLEKVKERILEYLAVQQRVRKLKGPILCLVGPPGVGKTSLGRSIARATNRKFTRMSLGGVRDEAEIRGHRRTYIGALPGKIIQNMSRVGTRNPLFLLDEIDKMAMDFRGDPASALLEVLDPEQNSSFADHYLEVDYDLSDTMFVATANSMNIPGPLLDRMEVIRIPGYTEDEKASIAVNYLIPKQIQANGLKANELSMSEAAIRDVVRYYTREAGVRNLEREISKICRKVVKGHLLKGTEHKTSVTPRNLDKYLGVRRFRYGIAEERDQIGQVTGLAWTEVGGELLTIESAVVPGKGKFTHTGKLGDVMQESIQAALTVVRSRASTLGIAEDFHEKKDIHVHVPEGATPKDGPSAGIGMCTAIVSALAEIPVRSDVAMTGEITLRGEVLPIGGLKEKLLAAHRGGITTVIIPQENEKDLVDIPKNIKSQLDIRPVRWIDEVLAIALKEQPQHTESEEVAKPVSSKTTRRASSRRIPHH